MEDLGVKSVIIGTSIFVTLIIVSLIFVSFNHMKEIYSLVNETDTSINNTFNTYYDQYNGKEVTGLELLNILKKIEDDETDVTVTYYGMNAIKNRAQELNIRELECLKELMDGKIAIPGATGHSYIRKHSVSVTQNNGALKIEFRIIGY